MKKLTKEERKEIYLKIAEKISKDENDFGMCYELKVSVMNWDSHCCYKSVVEQFFPEFKRMYPISLNASDYWKVSQDERIVIMCLCAAMCD